MYRYISQISMSNIKITVMTVWRQSERGKTCFEMVWACAGEGCRVYQKKNTEARAARQEEKRKNKVHGCCEGGYARGRCDRGRRREQSEMELDDLLW